MQDANALSPAAVADLCDQFIQHVDHYLLWDTLLPSPHQIGTLEGVFLGVCGSTAGDYEVRRTREALWLRENGPALADVLGRHGLNLTEVLEIVRDVEDPDNGPTAVRATWGNTQVVLQRAAILLRNSKPASKPDTADDMGESAKHQHGIGGGGGPLTKEAQAILFIKERIKTTGKLPPKTAIAQALDVDRRTLNNWTAFKVAYRQFQTQLKRPPPRGSKSADGTLEAWRESGK